MKKKKNKKKGEMPKFGSQAYIDWINKKNIVQTDNQFLMQKQNTLPKNLKKLA